MIQPKLPVTDTERCSLNQEEKQQFLETVSVHQGIWWKPEQDVDQILTWCPFGHQTHRVGNRAADPNLACLFCFCFLVMYVEGESYGDGQPQRRWDEGTSALDFRGETFPPFTGTLPAESSECLLPSQNQGGGRMPDVWLMASEDMGDNSRDKRDKTPKHSADTQSRPKSAF